MKSVLGQIYIGHDLTTVRLVLIDYLKRIDQLFVKSSYRGEAAWNPGSIASGGFASTTVYVLDARVGDAVAVFPPCDLQELGYSASVSADDTAEIVLQNNTGGAVDLDEGVWRLRCEKW